MRRPDALEGLTFVWTAGMARHAYLEGERLCGGRVGRIEGCGVVDQETK
jgi:hypothetical protein